MEKPSLSLAIGILLCVIGGSLLFTAFILFSKRRHDELGITTDTFDPIGIFAIPTLAIWILRNIFTDITSYQEEATYLAIGALISLIGVICIV